MDKGATMRSTRFRLITHGIAMGLFLLVLAVGVPKVERVFADFGAPLPQATVLVIRASHRSIAFMLSTLVLLGVDWSMLAILSRRGDAQRARAWSVSMIAMPLLMIALILVALGLPLITMDTLSG
jgi:type II secretory pathway component PulF